MKSSLEESKFFVAFGGLLGFTLAFFSGFFAGNDMPTVLRNASIAAVIGAFCMKGFGATLSQQMLDAKRKKERIRHQEAHASDEKSPDSN